MQRNARRILNNTPHPFWVELLIMVTVLLTVIVESSWAQEQTDTTTDIEVENKDDTPVYFLNLQLLPGLDVFGHSFKKVTNVFLFSTTVGVGNNIIGVGSAPVGLVNSGRVQGLQLSGVFNIVNGEMDGMQTASIFNIGHGTVRGVQLAGIFNHGYGDTVGFQGAGFFNHASGKFAGVQIASGFNWIEGDAWGIQVAPVNRRGEGRGVSVQVGLVNISDSPNVIPIGLINNVKGGMKHYYIFMDDMRFTNLGYRSGTRIFYSHSSYGFLPGQQEGDIYVLSRGGVGLEIPINKFFIDVDYARGNITTLRTENVKDVLAFFFGSNTSVFQLRLIVGYKIFERLGVFAGVSYDYLHQNKRSDPAPADFNADTLGKVDGANGYKVGLFGGVQY